MVLDKFDTECLPGLPVKIESPIEAKRVSRVLQDLRFAYGSLQFVDLCLNCIRIEPPACRIRTMRTLVAKLKRSSAAVNSGPGTFAAAHRESRSRHSPRSANAFCPALESGYGYPPFARCRQSVRPSHVRTLRKPEIADASRKDLLHARWSRSRRSHVR